MGFLQGSLTGSVKFVRFLFVKELLIGSRLVRSVNQHSHPSPPPPPEGEDYMLREHTQPSYWWMWCVVNLDYLSAGWEFLLGNLLEKGKIRHLTSSILKHKRLILQI